MDVLDVVVDVLIHAIIHVLDVVVDVPDVGAPVKRVVEVGVLAAVQDVEAAVDAVPVEEDAPINALDVEAAEDVIVHALAVLEDKEVYHLNGKLWF